MSIKPSVKILTMILGLSYLFSFCTKPTNACFKHSPENITSKTVVTFDATCTENGGYSYKWSFGDGTPDTIILGSASMTHTYQSKGNYTVKLSAGRKDGVTLRKGKETITKMINVQ